MNNQECKVRPEILNINSNEPSFYPYSFLVNKSSGSCNGKNDPYAKLCVSDVVKSMNIKVFNLMSRTNETRHVSWRETYKYRVSQKKDTIICSTLSCRKMRFEFCLFF